MKINIERGPGMPGRHQVLDEMLDVVRHSRRPIHNGRWGKATLEVALAIQQSAAEGREVALNHQIEVPLEETTRSENAGKVIVSARIADWPARGIYAKD